MRVWFGLLVKEASVLVTKIANLTTKSERRVIFAKREGAKGTYKTQMTGPSKVQNERRVMQRCVVGLRIQIHTLHMYKYGVVE